MKINPLAGKPVEPWMLVNVPRLITAYYADEPDPYVASHQVVFGTSGHRGTSFNRSFNEAHILAITQAICLFRKMQGIDGPLFIGIDTHALSAPAYATALEVLAGNGVHVIMAAADEFTPTPVISHAILNYNRDRNSGLADGIVITPSHNPPQDGGIKYNSTNGGPADLSITKWIERRANELLRTHSREIRRVPLSRALKESTTHQHDFLTPYIADLANVLDMSVIRDADLQLAVDPLGGAGIHYWGRIADFYRLNLTVVNELVDPAFGFMTVDWDGQIRMDPSSRYAMQRLIDRRDSFDISFACDPDHDRHGIVTKGRGLLPPNHYLCAAIYYLFRNRPKWPKSLSVGRTAVSSQMIDRIAAKLGKKVLEFPVGFKWFSEGLFNGTLGFAGEESAGAVFDRANGEVWTTDKDGIVPALLAAEMTARLGRDPGDLYLELTFELGQPVYDRTEVCATSEIREKLAALSPDQVKLTELAGEKIVAVTNNASGNGAALGGIKVSSENGWFAIRPSGTEEIYKIYAESFRGPDHLQRILNEAQTAVESILGSSKASREISHTTPLQLNGKIEDQNRAPTGIQPEIRSSPPEIGTRSCA